MKKRRAIAIFLCLSMIFLLYPGIGKAEQADAARENIKIWEDTLGEVSETGYVPVNKTILNKDDLHAGKRRMSARRSVSIPVSYDAREEGLTSEIRNQDVFGNCWAYAAMSASESNIKKKSYETQPDLSEYHLSYSVYNKALDPLGLTSDDVCRVKQMSNNVYSWGGHDYATIASLSRWQGIVEEEDAPSSDLFSAYKNNVTAIVPEDVLYKDSYHIQNAEFVYLSEDNRDLIKQKIMEYGSGTISYYSGTDVENKRYSNTGDDNYTAYYCNDASKETNHMVTVVGWDDNYAVSNFNSSCQPDKPGAWLLRNSWGSYNDMGGYFWISYEDTTLNVENDSQAEVTFYDVEPANRYEYNYQYDSGLPLRYIDGFESVANVFKAQHNGKIEAVSFYTQERNVTYKIELYRVLDRSNPKSGDKLGETITGQCNERGYHTVDFSEMGMEDVFVAKGDTFSVVLSLKDSSGAVSYYTIERPYRLSDLEEVVSGGTNQSFTYNGRSWTDLTQVDFGTQKIDANVCLKAFTTETTEIPTATATPTATLTSTPTVTATTSPTDNPTQEPTDVPTDAPTDTPTDVPTDTPTNIPTDTPSNVPTFGPTQLPSEKVESTQESSRMAASTMPPVVKKLKFSPASKKVKAGKKLKLSKYLKITKNRTGSAAFKYEFTKKKYKKYASLTRKGVLKAKKKGRKKTIYVRVRALDGSLKTAKIKIRIR